MAILLLLWNFGISWLNAWGVGRSWIESKAEGGFRHFVTWCAAVMSACGFTWCYLFMLAETAGHVPYKGHILLSPHGVQQALELGYLVIILPVIGSGLGITISSWQNFSRRRTLANGGVAAYNTYAQVMNTVEAARAIPGIFKDVSGLFSSKDSDEDSSALIFGIVALAVAGGFMTTFAIIRSTMKRHAMEVEWDLKKARVQAL